jgi:LmbE family N-acetylglucosaminyl deacetylase
VEVQSTKLELRLIAEKMRKRFSIPRRLEGTSWSPKIMDLPPGRRFLVVSPHPDDDAIGCGGTIIKLTDEGAEVKVVYLSMQEGDFTSKQRRVEIEAALGHLGVHDHYIREMSDMDFPSLSEATAIVLGEMERYNPDAVFAPSPFENHDQHLRTFEAVLRASASVDDPPDAILYEVWGTLMPNLIVPVSRVMPRKIRAIKEHGTQVSEIDYIRLAQGMNGYRAAASGLEGYAEAFMHLPSGDLEHIFS